MIKRSTLTLLILCLALSSFSQRNTSAVSKFNKRNKTNKGYIITDRNKYLQGFIKNDFNKEKETVLIFYKFIKDTPVELDIDTIKEYGYDEVVCEKVEHNGEMVFMQKMGKEHKYLLYNETWDGTKEFYLKDTEQIRKLPNNADKLKDILTNEFDSCDQVDDIIQFAAPYPNRMLSIFKRYGQCSNKKISYFKYGINIGTSYSIMKLKLDNFMNNGVMISNDEKITANTNPSSIKASIFLDIPLTYTQMGLTFHPELEFSKAKYVINDKNMDWGIDLVLSSFNAYFRYNTLVRNVSSYTDFGLIGSLANYSNINIDGDAAAYDLVDYLFGAGAGIGLDKQLRNRNTLNAGARLSFLMGNKNISGLYNLGIYLAFGF